ncbi:hypothetical protein THAOC_36776 [Thalassiosira oceanica]|uniref:Uncharacterized protein n=1 Tax=Thalassiosira oceanica TaxID=159749 RepID=K0QZN4_THAOC|nr:hypothetical protein THAOC_36776 [Thalassiosira oceanica]|eukprot:EJK44670.1 hypothetical protein THAOC_36776 [Thalassiosira oceanica]
MKRSSMSPAGLAAINRQERPQSATPVKQSFISRLRLKIRSFYYKIYYGAVIRATNGKEDARTVFLISLVMCLTLFFVPLMIVSTFIPRYERMDLEKLNATTVDHGTFYFSDNHESPKMKPIFRANRSGEEPSELCQRFGWEYFPSGPKQRNRGVLIGTTSESNLKWLRVLTQRAPDLVKSVSFIEIGKGDDPMWSYSTNSTKLETLRRSFGHTNFSVDYYVGRAKHSGLVQKTGHELRWRRDGILDDDKDTFILLGRNQRLSTSYLRARKICHLTSDNKCCVKFDGDSWCRDGYKSCGDMLDDKL